jgi:cytoskeletal protein RodZ
VAQRATNIGLRLRQAREARGVSLRDIAATTKISISALKAIEENNLSQLPGGLFGRAYLKAFATEVGLNGDELVREFRRQFEPEDTAPVVSVDEQTEPSTPPLRVEIRLIAECWVSASADGQRVLYRLMQAGERAHIEATEAIDLRIGDAGALEYSINGRAGPRLGRSGEVVTLQVTSDSPDPYVAPAAAEPPDTSPDVTLQTDPVRHIHSTQRAA